MTEPDDRELAQYLAGQHRLSQRYRAAAQADKPPPERDDAILAAARAATPPKRRSVRRWAVPFGLAASLMIGGPLVWQLRQTEPTQSLAIYESAKDFSAMPGAAPEESGKRMAALKAERAMAPTAAPPARSTPQAEAERGEPRAAAPPPPQAFSHAAPREQAVMADQSTPISPTHHFTGFGPAQFGDDEESVRIAWGRPLIEQGAEPETCRQLVSDPLSVFGISFMLVEGRFARYDVTGAQFAAPGGMRVGHTRAELAERYGVRLSAAPHKYIEGAEVLTVAPDDDSDARLVIEMTPEGKASSWRVGVPPSVHFVEGCG